jgi:NadR type nicotinamide-nucleotide adenylyltransferase
MIKVVVTGSESTGKTELARKLADHFHAPVSQEFVRHYAADRGGKLTFEDHGPIARGQIQAEDAAIGHANEIVVLDTDLVSTVVYCEHYFGESPSWVETGARLRAADLYLLMKPDVPWMPDGVRDRPDQRDEMHQLFKKKLDQFGLKYVEIGGSAEERFSRAVEAVTAVKAG